MRVFLRGLLCLSLLMGLASCSSAQLDEPVRACRPVEATLLLPAATLGAIRLPEGVVLTPELEAEIRAEYAARAQRFAQWLPATASGCGA